MVYVEANWAIHSLSNKINFFIDNCVIEQGGLQISIVKDNCYSKNAGISNLTPNHLVQNKSRFSFKNRANLPNDNINESVI